MTNIEERKLLIRKRIADILKERRAYIHLTQKTIEEQFYLESALIQGKQERLPFIYNKQELIEKLRLMLENIPQKESVLFREKYLTCEALLTFMESVEDKKTLKQCYDYIYDQIEGLRKL